MIDVIGGKKEEYLLGMAAEDSAFMTQVVPSISDPLHPDLPILLTLIQYFCQTEVSR